MDEIGTCHIGDGAYGVFSNAILVVGTDPTETQSLVAVLAVAAKESRIEHSIVGVDSIDGNSNVSSLAF
jgi:hypothetical protein